MAMLSPLGVSEIAERLYQSLVEEGPGSVDALARRCALSQRAVSGLVAELAQHRLVATRDGEVSALAPTAELERLAEEHSRAARAAAESARELSSWWSRNHFRVGYADFLRSGELCRATEVRIVSEAKREVVSLTTGAESPRPDSSKPDSSADSSGDSAEPEVVHDKLPPADLTRSLQDAVDRGVEFRGVYSQSLFRADASRRAVLARQAVGEQVRLFSELPVSLTIADREVAIVGYAASYRDEFHSLQVRPSGLLDLLIDVFETFWRLASPLRDPAQLTGDRLSPDERELLSLLKLGVTDGAIARELGVSERTVTRRVGRLQDVLGVRSRFQLGAQAAERGWV